MVTRSGVLTKLKSLTLLWLVKKKLKKYDTPYRKLMQKARCPLLIRCESDRKYILLGFLSDCGPRAPNGGTV